MGPDDIEKEHLLHSEAVEEIKRLKEVFLAKKNPTKKPQNHVGKQQGSL